MAVAVVVLVLTSSTRSAPAPARRDPLRPADRRSSAAVLEARRRTRTSRRRGAPAATVGLASIWALEAFAYTLITAAASSLSARAAPAGERRRLPRCGSPRWPPPASSPTSSSPASTLAAAGELPRWGRYLETLREFLAGGIGDLTYDFAPWSAGLAAGALYLGSAVAVALIVRRRPDLAERERPPSSRSPGRPPTASRCSATSSTAPPTTSFPTSPCRW